MLFATASFHPFNFLYGSRFIFNKNTNLARAVAIFCKYPLVVFMFIALNIDILIKEIIVICSKKITLKFYQLFCLIVFPPLCQHLLSSPDSVSEEEEIEIIETSSFISSFISSLNLMSSSSSETGS